jgi:site-specific recombinase XerD
MYICNVELQTLNFIFQQMAEAFFFLRKGTKNSHKEISTRQPIYVGCRLNKDQLVYPTGFKVLPKYWDFDKSKIKNVTAVSNKDEINVFLHDLKEFIDRTIEKYKLMREPLTKAELKECIDNYINPQQEEKAQTLFEYIEQFITEIESGKRLMDSGKSYEYKSVQRFRSTQKLIQEFQSVYSRTIDFETIDLSFYKEFNSYMANVKDYRPDTMGKHQKTLKTFLRNATDDGVNENLDFQKKAFKITSKDNTESIHIALNEDELKELFELDLSANPRLDKIRDLFLVACHTGLRWTDFEDIRPENIKITKEGEFIEIIQEKMKRHVVTPINAIVKTIVNKYNHILPTSPSNQKFNDYIKEVAQLCKSLQDIETLAYVKGGKNIEESMERWRMVSSHTGRRTFSTNAFERGVPTKVIMAITDHKSEKAFLSYIKTSKRKQAQMFLQYDK